MTHDLGGNGRCYGTQSTVFGTDQIYSIILGSKFLLKAHFTGDELPL